MRRLGPAVLLFGVALLLAGCGSTYTRRDFTRRADGVCLSATRAVRSLNPPRFSGSAALQRASSARYIARVARIVQSEADQLRSLRRPPQGVGARQLLRRWLAAVASSGHELARLATALQSGNLRGAADLSRALAALQVVALARRYGVAACAGPGASYAGVAGSHAA